MVTLGKVTKFDYIRRLLMKKLILTTALLFATNTLANNTCSDGTCPNYPSSENEVWSQDQSQAISNANTAVMQQQMYLSSPIGNIPVNSVGKDGASCAQSFSYVSAGASKARLSGVQNNAFGNGSWAAGVQVGRVFADKDNNCAGFQSVMKESAEFSFAVESNMHCLRTYRTHVESNQSPLKTLLRLPKDNLIRTTCQPMFELWASNDHERKVVEENLAKAQAAMSQPQYQIVREKVKVGYHEYRVRFLDWVNGCDKNCNSATGFASLKEYLNEIKKNLPKTAKVFTVPYNNQKRISIFVRDSYFTETEAYIGQQRFFVAGFTSFVQGVSGAEKWKIVEKKVLR